MMIEIFFPKLIVFNVALVFLGHLNPKTSLLSNNDGRYRLPLFLQFQDPLLIIHWKLVKNSSVKTITITKLLTMSRTYFPILMLTIFKAVQFSIALSQPIYLHCSFRLTVFYLSLYCFSVFLTLIFNVAQYFYRSEQFYYCQFFLAIFSWLSFHLLKQTTLFF